MPGVESNPGEDSFTSTGRCGSILKRRGSVVGSSKGGRVVEGTGGISIAGEHLGNKQGKVIAKARETNLSGSLGPACLGFEGGQEVSPGLHHLRGVRHWPEKKVWRL